MHKSIPDYLLVVIVMLFMVSCGQSQEGDEMDKKADSEKTAKVYSAPAEPYIMDENPRLIIETDLGDMEMELFLKESPMTASNFLYLVREKYYDGLIWHRVIPKFVIQSGDPTGTGMGGPGYVINFEVNEKKHVPGAVAMARGRDINTAGSQFYITLEAQPNLDRMKYCVFGQLVSGLDIARKIAAVERDRSDKPLEPIHIKSIYEKNLFIE